MIVWWTPAQRRKCSTRELRRKGRGVERTCLSSASSGVAGLEWRTQYPGAHRERRGLGASTKLAVAPYWNLSDDGRVCTGTMRRPDSASVGAILSWERGFYESAFTHANVGRLTRHEGGFEALWTGLAEKRQRFPLQTLIVLPQTLTQFVRGERA